MNKLLYKTTVIVLKILPMLLAFITLLNSILSYDNIDLVILSYIGGVSLITILFIYITSYTFKFCEYHRMFLYYIVVTWIIKIIKSAMVFWFMDEDYTGNKVKDYFKL